MKNKLAIEGGESILKREDYKNWPIVNEDSRFFVNETLERGIFAGGASPQVSKLEKEWADYLGVKYCLTTGSGTAALHMAVSAIGIKPGDEVLTSAFTFLASATCAIHQGAIPIFSDIDEKTYNIDPDKIEQAITERTKAIIPVHIQGLAADMDPIIDIAKKNNLFIIEDASQSQGAMYKGKKTGTMGDVAAFSINVTKNLPGGEGGLFVTNDEDILNKARLIRSFGDDIDEVSNRRKYNASILGYMYRNQELPAAFTRGQLMHLEEYNDLRIQNANYLTKKLSKIPGIITPHCPADCKHVYFMYNIRLDPKAAGVDYPSRDFRIAIEKALYKEGVLVGQWQTMPVPGQDIFQSKLGFGGSKYPWIINEEKGIKYDYSVDKYPVAKELCDNYTVVHGIHPPNDIKLMEKIVAAFEKVFSDIDAAMKHVNDAIYPGPSGGLYGELGSMLAIDQ